MSDEWQDGIDAGPAAGDGEPGVEKPPETPEAQAEAEPPPSPGRRLTGRHAGSPFRRPLRGELPTESRSPLSPEQRLLVLDAWQRSKLPLSEFAPIVQVSPQTLLAWRRRFESFGPEGLSDKPRGAPSGSRVPEAVRRAIVMMKEAHPEWGAERIHALLLRGEGFAVSAGAILRVLKESGYESAQLPTRPHPEAVQHFERARPNQLWQSDLFTFTLKREGRRLYLVIFLDDHSRFVVSYGLHASASGALVREVLEAGIANFGAPEEVLTDNGPQYASWRGKSAFARLLERRGIRHLLARPRRPQTLGKCERFWGTLWRECVEAAVFTSLEEARRRVGLFVDHYNFQRPHQGIGGLVPADRFFGAAPQVLEALRGRVAANALDLARLGAPRQSFYLAGRVGGEGIALHGEGGRVVLTRSDGRREEVDLQATGRRAEPAGGEFVWPEAVAVTCEEIRETDDGVEVDGGGADVPEPGHGDEEA